VKILIVGTIDAQHDNREEVLCERLQSDLKKRNHEVYLCYLPFKRDLFSAVEQIFAYSLIDTHRSDALITVGYPACFVPHKNDLKVSYLFDCYPQIHEEFTFKLREHKVEERSKIIEAITQAEEKTLKTIKAIFTASTELNDTINKRYGVTGQVLYFDDENISGRIEGALL